MPVNWVSDPMHGNTFMTEDGVKTRHCDNIMAEINACFDIHKQKQSVMGGIHLELVSIEEQRALKSICNLRWFTNCSQTGENVTECIGGSQELGAQHLNQAYTTLCDPRLVTFCLHHG